MSKHNPKPAPHANNFIGTDGELKQSVNLPIPDDRPATYTDKKQDHFRPHRHQVKDERELRAEKQRVALFVFG